MTSYIVYDILKPLCVLENLAKGGIYFISGGHRMALIQLWMHPSGDLLET